MIKRSDKFLAARKTHFSMFDIEEKFFLMGSQEWAPICHLWFVVGQLVSLDTRHSRLASLICQLHHQDVTFLCQNVYPGVFFYHLFFFNYLSLRVFKLGNLYVWQSVSTMYNQEFYFIDVPFKDELSKAKLSPISPPVSPPLLHMRW